MSPKFDPKVSNSPKVSQDVCDVKEVGVEGVLVPVVDSIVVVVRTAVGFEVAELPSECTLMRKSEVLCGAAGTETKGEVMKEASSHSGTTGSWCSGCVMLFLVEAVAAAAAAAAVERRTTLRAWRGVKRRGGRPEPTTAGEGRCSLDLRRLLLMGEEWFLMITRRRIFLILESESV